jgi:hypothetical protein
MDREGTHAEFCLAWWQVSVPNLEGENFCLKMSLRSGQKVLVFVWLAKWLILCTVYLKPSVQGGGGERSPSMRYSAQWFLHKSDLYV